MFPIILERDSVIVDWTSLIAWSTTETDPRTPDSNVRSDGVVYQDYGTLYTSGLTGTITANASRCTGLHIAGPEPGDEFTAYALSCVAMAEDPQVRPYLFVAESPAAPSATSVGQTCGETRFLAFADAPKGNGGAELAKDTLVVVAESTNKRGLCFGVGMLATGPAGGATEGGYIRLCVRRLVGPGPRIVDIRKL